MRQRLLIVTLLLSLASCAGTGTIVPQEQAAQFQQAAGFPYNSFYCP
ncbi:MAG: hypothetical protein QOD26_2561 [Betaproteobacteria bacterium]|jgi:hypothetical protein|nr:hypothetical protein [Betaproteobacteria bacterium]